MSTEVNCICNVCAMCKIKIAFISTLEFFKQCSKQSRETFLLVYVRRIAEHSKDWNLLQRPLGLLNEKQI